jgi:Xaa-Pro aminopeptidase
MLTDRGCQARRNRLRAEMEALGCGLFVSGNYRTAYYLTGVLGSAETPLLAAMWQDGTTALLTSAEPGSFSGEVVKLEAYSIDRCITQPFHEAAARVGELTDFGPSPMKAAIEAASVPAVLMDALRRACPATRWIDAPEVILRLRKRKEEDEIDQIRASLRCAAAGYRAAREAIRPGADEIDVYNAIQAAATREFGTSVPFPGDFASGERCVRGGGPPTRRKLQPGDLYILDLFPAPALYFGDVCRTFAVSEPTDLQRRAYAAVRAAMQAGEAAARPGVKGCDVYAAVKAAIEATEFRDWAFWHHAGHGIGHFGHEAPRLIPGSQDALAVGDVFTLEPGVYASELGGGIRLEDNYVVRPDGLENLFDFPFEL